MSFAAGQQSSHLSEVDASRSFLKCNYCRLKHKKCLPAVRIWPGTRCSKCEEADLPCGPPERSAAKRARMQPSSVATGQIGTSLPLSPYPKPSLEPPPAVPLQQHLPTSAPTPHTPDHPPAHLPQNYLSSSLQRSLGSSTKSSSHKAPALFTSPTRGPPVHLNSAPNGLVPRLIHLGLICILYEYLKGLEKAATSPPLHTVNGNAISGNIKRLAWCTGHAVKSEFKVIIELIEAEGNSIESQTLRYREALDTVEDINKLGSRNEVFVQLEVTILSKLILIYEQQGDTPTVRRFSLRRSKLNQPSCIYSEPCHVTHAAQCWAETCNQLPELLDNLNLQIEPPLYASGAPRFPPQQSALRCGHNSIIDTLCNQDGAQQNRDLLGQNPVLAAAAVGSLSLLNRHLQNDKNLLKNRDLFQRTALFLTAHSGNLDTFRILVETGANVLDRDEAGQSILGIASAAGNTDIVRWLLDLKDVSSPNDHYIGSRSPLHDAARAGHVKVCSVLLEKGAYADYPVDGVTAAEAARANGFDALANMLESALANPANRLFPTQLVVQANDTQSSHVLGFNLYACPPPFEVRSTQHAP